MEQLVARRAHNPKVVGSSPAPATQVKLKAFRDNLRAFLFGETLIKGTPRGTQNRHRYTA
jgi:hypothetical protein